MRSFFLGILVSISILITTVTVFKHYNLVLNNTSSYPIGIYRVLEKKMYEKGDMVSFCAPLNETVKKLVSFGFASGNSTCKNNTPVLLKKLVALHGDVITIKDKFVFVNNNLQKNSNIYFVGSSGNVLEKQNSQVIESGNFWAMSDYNKKSYDSRYYGQVELSNIIGSAEPIITW